jgi:glycolate oxidase iron-sulfur subunit
MDAANLLADADRCVKCGLCLPHCPTYRLSRSEAESPRGRIALAQGLVGGQLQASATLAAHIDSCLSCRACEAVCPAKVPYGRIADATRGLLVTPRRSRATRLLAALLDYAPARALLRTGLWLLQRLLGAPSGSPQLPRWLRYRPTPQRLRAVPAPASAKVGLFVGCVGDVLERAVLADALRVLEALGIEAAVPPAQGCCGALNQHAGLATDAARQAARNAQAFAGCETVLALASGCGASLRDLGAATAEAPALTPKVQDLCAFLAARLETQPLPLRPLPLRVAIHSACTQANVFGAGGAIHRLLVQIPQLELVDLAGDSGCCGAAGTGFLSAPEQADRLLAPKLDAAARLAPQLIVSANIGCALHLAAGLRGRGLKVEVLHPLSLLARALAPATPAPG